MPGKSPDRYKLQSVKLERVGAEEAALEAGDVRAELSLAPAELLVELGEPLLALLERLGANECFRLELGLALLELGDRVGRSAGIGLLQEDRSWVPASPAVMGT